MPFAAMELGREHFPAMIFYDFQSGLSENQCLERLRACLIEVLLRVQPYRWFSE